MRLTTFRRGALAALAAVLATVAVAPPAEALLSYSLSSALKKGGCSGDTDADCLDNAQESSLAWAVSPWYFYDEDEDCSGWTNKYGLPSSHFVRRDYVQVRPHDSAVGSWSSTDGRAKWVVVTFFFLYPHDCGGNFGFAGHQGDTERVKFYLYSYDLVRWYLSYSYYDHHGRTDYVSGSFLESRALQLGTAWASVAADEDKHGSWPGKDVGSSHCAGSMDDFCYSTCDCFINTWQSDFSRGYYDVPSGSRNVGGPYPETWNPTYVTSSGGNAWTDLNVGHGLNREYWSPRSDAYRYFCGWQCAAAYRKSDGHCAVSIHGESGCAEGPLSQKVDGYLFNVGAVSAASSAATASTAAGPEAELDLAPSAGDPPSVARAKRASASAMAARAAEAGGDPAAHDAEARWRARRAADPVAAQVGLLLDLPRSEQLAILRWALTVPDPLRLVALFDDLGGSVRGRSEEVAERRVRDLVAWLEAEGIEALTAPAEPLAAPAPDAPEPDRYPQGRELAPNLLHE